MGFFYSLVNGRVSWRLNQMQRADHYLEETALNLRGKMQRQRQNEITVELENLMSALDTD